MDRVVRSWGHGAVGTRTGAKGVLRGAKGSYLRTHRAGTREAQRMDVTDLKITEAETIQFPMVRALGK